MGKKSTTKSTGSAKSSSGGKKPRRRRTKISPEQREKLEAVFVVTPKPLNEVHVGLAEDTGLPLFVVKNWFQNRMARERRIKEKVRAEAASSKRRRQRRGSDDVRPAKRQRSEPPNSHETSRATSPNSTPRVAPSTRPSSAELGRGGSGGTFTPSMGSFQPLHMYSGGSTGPPPPSTTSATHFAGTAAQPSQPSHVYTGMSGQPQQQPQQQQQQYVNYNGQAELGGGGGGVMRVPVHAQHQGIPSQQQQQLHHQLQQQLLQEHSLYAHHFAPSHQPAQTHYTGNGTLAQAYFDGSSPLNHSQHLHQQQSVGGGGGGGGSLGVSGMEGSNSAQGSPQQTGTLTPVGDTPSQQVPSLTPPSESIDSAEGKPTVTTTTTTTKPTTTTTTTTTSGRDSDDLFELMGDDNVPGGGEMNGYLFDPALLDTAYDWNSLPPTSKNSMGTINGASLDPHVGLLVSMPGAVAKVRTPDHSVEKNVRFGTRDHVSSPSPTTQGYLRTPQPPTNALGVNGGSASGSGSQGERIDPALSESGANAVSQQQQRQQQQQQQHVQVPRHAYAAGGGDVMFIVDAHGQLVPIPASTNEEQAKYLAAHYAVNSAGGAHHPTHMSSGHMGYGVGYAMAPYQHQQQQQQQQHGGERVYYAQQ